MKDITYGPTKTIYRGKIFTLTQQAVTLPNGKKDVFEFCERLASVNILALNEKGELLLTREYRENKKTPDWFIPAGQVQKGENPRQAAQRELREEAGYRAKKIKLLKKSSSSDKLLWDVYVFVASDLVYDPLPPDPGEVITVVPTPVRQAAQMAIEGMIGNDFIAYHILRLDYRLKREKLTT